MSEQSLRNGRTFTIRVRFDSDWVCGTGTGRHGSVDQQVQRDHDGFPYLRGKALAAMLRDAAEGVAAGLDEGDHGLWHDWVLAVFGSQPANRGATVPAGGSPVPSVIIARPLRLPATLRAAVLARDDARRVADATVLTRSGVRIGPNGVATDDTLRFEERARAGLTVEGDWQLRFPGVEDGTPVPWEAELLLLAAASTLQAIGGNRRRGAGRCAVELEVPGSVMADRLTELLDRIDDAATPAPVAGAPDATPLGARNDEPLTLWRELRITAQTPLVAIQRVRGNVVLTEQFVPGTVLLPIVARAAGAAASELITSGRLVVTAATVELDGRRSEPAPRVLVTSREAPDDDLTNLLYSDSPGPKPQTVSGFCAVADGGLLVGRPELVEQAHAVIDDQKQRPTEDSGGLFVNQAIAAGTVLRAQIWAAAGTEFDEQVFAGEHALGRSRKDDYGHVRFELCDPPDGARPARAEHADLIVWLLADVLLRGEHGEPDPSVDWLAAVLGEQLDVRLTPDTAYGTGNRVESWQTRWALPRPSLVGLRAGSVLRFTVDGVPDPDRWRRVEANGIGERTAEGFGRVALDPPFLRQERVPRVAAPVVAADSVPDVAAGADLTRLLTWRWREELRRSVLTCGADADKRADLVPDKANPAQLGVLRTLADRMLIDNPDTTVTVAWITGTLANTDRANTWGRDRLNRLKKLVTDPAAPWDWLGLTPDADVAEQLRVEAAAGVLAEVARVQTRATQADRRTSREERS